MSVDKSQDGELSKIYEGREDVLDKGVRRLGPRMQIKLTNVLCNDPKAFFFLKKEISKGRTADMISVEEFRKAGAKERTINFLLGL